MKLIEAMKQIKDLLRKREDLHAKIAQHCAHLSFETPAYADTKQQVNEWLQSCEDINKKILSLRIAVQRTNLATNVTIELGGKQVTKSIAEWIHRRRDLADADRLAYTKLTDKNLKEGIIKDTMGQTKEMKIVRNFDAATRDERIEMYRAEPSTIDATLEVVNAVTDAIVE